MLGKLLKKVMNLVVLAALVWAAWYGYSQWRADSSGSVDAAQEAGFNCRHALARLAEDYKCRASDSCTLTDAELTALKKREADIEQHCN